MARSDKRRLAKRKQEPVAEQPRMATGYLEAKRLPWSWARRRLERARNYWVASVSDRGTAHSRPVWGVWHEGGFYFSTGSLIRKHVQRRPEITIHLESGNESVILEGRAELEKSRRVLRTVASAYTAKYTWPMKATPGTFFRFEPSVAFGWLSDDSGEDGGLAFSASATRWRF